MKNKTLPFAIILNLLFPGIGYIYLKKWLVGLFISLFILFFFLAVGWFSLTLIWLIANIIMAIDMSIYFKKYKEKIPPTPIKRHPPEICQICKTEFFGNQCPNCGVKTFKLHPYLRDAGIIVLSVIVLFLAALFFPQLFPQNNPPAQKTVIASYDIAKDFELLNKFDTYVKSGQLTSLYLGIQTTGITVILYVSDSWHYLSKDMKISFIHQMLEIFDSLARSGGHKENTVPKWLDIKHAYSNRLLASWSIIWGEKIND